MFCVKFRKKGKTLEAEKSFCSVMIPAIGKFSFYRIREKIHLHGNNIPKYPSEAEKYAFLCKSSHPKCTHRMWGEEVLKRAELYNQTGLDLNSGSTTN